MSDPRVSFAASVTSGDAAEVARRLGSTELRIVVAPEAIRTLSGQVLVWQLASLVYRLLDRVTIEGDEWALGHPGYPFVGGRYLRALRSRLAELRRVEGVRGAAARVIRIVVGRGVAVDADLYVGCGRWVARLSCIAPQEVLETETTLGAIAAGALGASEVFKLVFADLLTGGVPLRRGKKEQYAFSLLTYGDSSDDPELPQAVALDAVLFGVGSIGCGFLFAALTAPQLTGSLVFVDNAQFDNRNPFKYQLLDWTSASAKLHKAVWAQSQVLKFAGPRLRALSFVGTARSYVASLKSEYTIPMALSAVDTPDARLEIQDTLPAWIANAGVDGTVAEVSVHGFGNGPCLGCLALQGELESWNAKPIAELLGLDPARVHELIVTNGKLTYEDLAAVRSAGRLAPDLLAQLDTFIDQSVLSIYNRLPYSEAAVATASGQARVTTAFVSGFAGALLFAEAVKRAAGFGTRYSVANSYRQDLAGVPAEGVFKYKMDDTGACACASNFRQIVYREKYGVFPSV